MTSASEPLSDIMNEPKDFHKKNLVNFNQTSPPPSPQTILKRKNNIFILETKQKNNRFFFLNNDAYISILSYCFSSKKRSKNYAEFHSK